MMKSRMFAAGLVAVGLSAPALGAIVEISTADGNGADATVVGADSTGSYTNTYGTHPDFLQAGGGFYVAYLRFDLSGVDVSQITSASLVIQNRYNNGVAQDLSLYGLLDGYAGGTDFTGDGVADLGEDWAETTISGPNAPGWYTHADSLATPPEAYGPVASAFYDGGAPLLIHAATDMDFASQQEIASSADFVSFLQTDTNGIATLVLWGPGAGSSTPVKMSPKEHAEADPTLTLNLNDVPEPASAGVLAGLGGLFMLRRRRQV